MENIDKAVMNLSATILMPDLVTIGVRNMWDGIRSILAINDLPGEVWKDAYDCFGSIMVSSFMRVKHIGLRTPIILSQKLNGEGYWQIRFTYNGRRIGKRVHRLYAAAFMNNPYQKKYINHKNLIKSDNIPLNMEWSTELENTLHAKINGAIPCGEAVKHSKLTKEQVMEIYNSKDTSNNIEHKYGINKRMVYKIRSGKSWVSVTGGVQVFNKRTYDDEVVKSIYLDKRTPSEVSRSANVPLSVVCRIKNRQSYKSILDGLN